MFEDLHIRFPHLSVAIFDQLDDQSLSKCREVCKSWLEFLDQEKFIRTRIIRIIKNAIECYKSEILELATVENLSKLACAVRQFYKKTPRANGQTLLHFAAMTGKRYVSSIIDIEKATGTIYQCHQLVPSGNFFLVLNQRRQNLI